MTLSDNEKQGLAELRSMPAYMTLMGVLAEYEQCVLGDLASQPAPDDILRNGRFYQFLNAMRSVLQSTPDQAFEELERLRFVEDGHGNLVPRDRLWIERFASSGAAEYGTQ